MATARVLPSGTWRVIVYDGKDENGKKKYKSITGNSKAEVEMAAQQYLNDPSRHSKEERMTVKDAVERYISSKEGVLSPSTIYGYRRMQKNRFDNINGMPIDDLTSEDMQKFISETSRSVSAKYTANVYGLLSASMAMFRPDAVFRITLPRKPSKRLVAPSDKDVQKLFVNADDRMKICIALAAYGSLRRGEVCALKYGDINGDTVYVHADMVTDNDNVYHYKEFPKTSESARVVRLPKQVIDMMGTGDADDYILNIKPYTITKGFIALRDSLGLDIKYHDLRHYYASIGAVLGVPDIYIADFGGWKRNSPVLKTTYQNIMDDKREEYLESINMHFSGLIDPRKTPRQKKVQHKRQHA